MEKLKMQTADMAEKNIELLGQLFPNCLTEIKNDEGKLVRAIDFDKLRQELACEVVEGAEERYQFTWPDKRAAIRLANAPTNKTLRPCREESVDFDNTENLYIEGDNLEVLKLLRENYLGKVKMIYIDPPYNTGNDFVYNDDFAQGKAEFEGQSGLFDEEGNRMVDPMVQNTESNGRFHTDWLNMIYPRLKVAKDLLSDDGVIFISIDDNEQDNLKKICNEIFGESNFLAQLIWQRAFSPKNDARYVSISHDYVLMIAKNIDAFVIGRLDRTEEANARYSNPDNDPRGVWMSSDISVKTYNAACDYPITAPSGRIIEPPAGRCWRLSKKAFFERLQDNRIWFGPNGDNTPRIKRFLSELKNEGMAPTSILLFKEVGHSQEGAQEVVTLFGDKGVFDGPKPVRLFERLITHSNLKDDTIVLDFFSGSASTAHALMKYNVVKNKKAKFILVQIPELVSDKKKNQGFNTICDIGKERIRRAGRKIKEDLELEKIQQEIKDLKSQRSLVEPDFWTSSDNLEKMINEKEELFKKIETLDTGFRVLKLDESNMADIYYTPADTHVQQTSFFDNLVNNVRDGRTPEDLLFQVMPECNLPLSSKIEEREMYGKKVFVVNDGYLIACFDKDINEAVITAIAKEKPYYFVMRDSSMASDNVADNFDQIFNAYSKETIRRIL